MHVNLIIGGASKAGTTAMYNMLQQVDEVFLPAQKELHFFSRKYLIKTTAGQGDSSVIAQIPKSFSDYLECFKGKRSDQIGVDISPSYLFHYYSAEDIADFLPDVKIIFILRRPDQKAFSQYVHLRGEGRENLSFENALQEEEYRELNGWSDMWLYRKSGLYSDAIEHFFQVFGKDRVKIILYEEFVNTPKAVLSEIFRFANISGCEEVKTEIRSNESGLPKSTLLARLISPNPLTNFARDVLPRRLGGQVRSAVRSLNRGEKPNISAKIEHDLRVFYETDIAKLEGLICRTTGWRLKDQDIMTSEKD